MRQQFRMLFRRRKKHVNGEQSGSGNGHEPSLGFLVEFDRMMKGNVFERRDGPVRQFGVTVDGATKLVTSGDRVDRETYIALIDAGALPPDPSVSSKRSKGLEMIEDDPAQARIIRQ